LQEQGSQAPETAAVTVVAYLAVVDSVDLEIGTNYFK
jgi:hypothetical protein